MKKLSSLIAFVLFFSLNISVQANFPDVADDADYYQAVTKLTELEVIEGYPNGTFQPNQLVNRAEFLQMAYKARVVSDPGFAGLDAPKDLNCFSDVNASQWFAESICAAKQEGVIHGYSTGDFLPGQPVNAVEGVKMLVGMLDLQPSSDVEDRLDMVEHWASIYLKTIPVKTLPSTIHAPDQFLTRSQAAEIIWRLLFASNNELDSLSATVIYWDADNQVYLVLDYFGSVFKTHYLTSSNDVYALYDMSRHLIKTEADLASFKIQEVTADFGGQDQVTVGIPLDKNSLYNPTEGLQAGGSRGQYFELFDGTQSRNEDDFSVYGHDAYHIFILRCFGQHCYIMNKFESSDQTSIENFKYFGHGIARTHDFVYVDGERIEGVDMATFEYLGGSMYRDKDNTYNGEEIYIPIDSETFEPVIFNSDNPCPSPFSKDKNHVFLNEKAMEGIDPLTFKVIQEQGFYFEDKNGVYTTFHEQKGPACAPDGFIELYFVLSDFKILGFSYLLNKDDIYYVSTGGGVTLSTANPLTFEIYEMPETNVDPNIEYTLGSFGHDDENIYYQGKILNGFDLETFAYDSALDGPDGASGWHDKNHPTLTWPEIYAQVQK